MNGIFLNIQGKIKLTISFIVFGVLAGLAAWGTAQFVPTTNALPALSALIVVVYWARSIYLSAKKNN